MKRGKLIGRILSISFILQVVAFILGGSPGPEFSGNSFGELVTAAGVESPTQVGGIISENTTWTAEDGSYEITETVQIPAGVTLTIEPGVIVTKPTGGDLFLLNGIVYAHGTPENKIVFDGGGNSNFFSAKCSSADTFLDLRYVIIRNGLSFWPATACQQYGYFHLRDSVLKNVVVFSYVWYPENDVYVEYNRFENSAGFSCGHHYASVYIRWNRFESRPTLPEYSDYWVQNWAAYGGQTVVQYNSFINVGDIALKLPSGYSPAAMVATHNYWATTDTEVIEDMIYDKNDDITSGGYIIYSPILAEPDAQTPSKTGDANGDGFVDTGDITKVKRIYFGLDPITPRADVNGDGLVDTGDITNIKRIYFGLDTAT